MVDGSLGFACDTNLGSLPSYRPAHRGGWRDIPAAVKQQRRSAQRAGSLGHGWPYLGWLAPLALGTLGAVVARLMVVRIAPEAEGSGVQRVEAIFRQPVVRSQEGATSESES